MAQKLNVANLRIKSPAFEGHKRIPDKHTSNGEDVAPPLEWSGAPEGTQAFAIVVHDPDAPLVDGFTHWVAYGIPASTSSMAGAPAGAAEGVNDFGRRGYGGPCPPRGPAHHYHVVVLALDTRLGLAAGATRHELESRISGHVLGTGELVATYQRA